MVPAAIYQDFWKFLTTGAFKRVKDCLIKFEENESELEFMIGDEENKNSKSGFEFEYLAENLCYLLLWILTHRDTPFELARSSNKDKYKNRPLGKSVFEVNREIDPCEVDTEDWDLRTRTLYFNLVQSVNNGEINVVEPEGLKSYMKNLKFDCVLDSVIMSAMMYVLGPHGNKEYKYDHKMRDVIQPLCYEISFEFYKQHVYNMIKKMKIYERFHKLQPTFTQLDFQRNVKMRKTGVQEVPRRGAKRKREEISDMDTIEVKDKRLDERINLVKKEIRLVEGCERLFGRDIVEKKYISISSMREKLRGRFNVCKKLKSVLLEKIVVECIKEETTRELVLCDLLVEYKCRGKIRTSKSRILCYEAIESFPNLKLEIIKTDYPEDIEDDIEDF